MACPCGYVATAASSGAALDAIVAHCVYTQDPTRCAICLARVVA
jgi:hypothetical protein